MRQSPVPSAALSEQAIHAADRIDFGVGPGHQDDPVRLQALLRANSEFGLGLPVLVNQLSTQSVPSQTALSKAKPNEAALTGEDLNGEFAAVLAGHRPFHALDNRRAQAAIVLELLRTVVNDDARLLAEEFVVRALVSV